MAQNDYIRSERKLPKVALPDWELIREVVEFFEPYVVRYPVTVSARDSRGTYSGWTVDEVEAAMAKRRERPKSLHIEVGANHEPGTGRVRVLRVEMDEWGTELFCTSGDEALVDHAVARVAPMIQRAGARCGEAEAVTAVGGGDRATGDDTVEAAYTVGRPAVAPDVAPVSSPSRWRRVLHAPNPWVLAIGGAIIAAIVGVIVAAISGAFG